MNMILYFYFGGLKLNRLLKKTDHKKEQEKKMRQDYLHLCSSHFWKNLLFLIISLTILFFTRNTASGVSHFLVWMLRGIFAIVFSVCILQFSEERKSIRKDIIYEICKSCGEYANWDRNEELVDEEDELKTDIEYHDSTIYSRKGREIGTIRSPIAITRKVTHSTYYVTRKCNCCGQVYYYYDERTR